MRASTAEKLAPPQAETEAKKPIELVAAPEQPDLAPDLARGALENTERIAKKVSTQALTELGDIAQQIEVLAEKERWDRGTRKDMAEKVAALQSAIEELRLKFSEDIQALQNGIKLEAELTGRKKAARLGKETVRQTAAAIRVKAGTMPSEIKPPILEDAMSEEYEEEQKISGPQQEIINAAHGRALKVDAKINAERDKSARQSAIEKEKEMSALEKIERGKAKEAKNLAKDMVWAKKDIGEQEGDDTKRRENEGKPEKVKERVASLLIQRGISSESELQNNLFLNNAIKDESGLKQDEIPTQADFDKVFAKKESIKKAQESERARIAQEARDKIAKKEQEARAKTEEKAKETARKETERRTAQEKEKQERMAREKAQAEKKQETEKQTALNNLASKLKKAEFNGRAAFTGSGGLKDRETAGRVNLAKELLKNPAYSNASELPSELTKLLEEKMEMAASQLPDKKDFEAAKESLDNSREGVELKLQRTYKKDTETIQRILDIYDDLTQGGPFEDSVLGQIALLSREQGITVEQLREFMPGVKLPSAEAVDARITKNDGAAERVSGKAWKKKVKGYKAGNFGDMSETARESMYLEENQLRAVASAKKTTSKPGLWSKLKSLLGGGEKQAVPPQERKGRKAA